MGTTSCAVPNNLYAILTNYQVYIAMPTWYRCTSTPILFWPPYIPASFTCSNMPPSNCGRRTSLFRQELVFWLNHFGILVIFVCFPHVNEWEFLAPPAERQRSFSNAELSVVRRRPSSSVVVVRRPSSTFHLKSSFLRNCLITFFLLWHVHVALLGRYQCTVQMWIWLNHPKGPF